MFEELESLVISTILSILKILIRLISPISYEEKKIVANCFQRQHDLSIIVLLGHYTFLNSKHVTLSIKGSNLRDRKTISSKETGICPETFSKGGI